MATSEELRAALVGLEASCDEDIDLDTQPLMVLARRTLHEALDELALLRARVTALQTALAQATNGYLHQTGGGTGYTVWHCRLCGDTTFDLRAPNHHAGCPVLVLTESERKE